MTRVLSVARLRIATDGQGVTTLVAFHGCPLDCKYCLNAECKTGAERFREITPQSLLDEVMIDNLYFLATEGGITFGGGEPLLNADFIKEFKSLCDPRWKLNIETSLNVPQPLLETVAQLTDHFIIDVKDMNPDIYLAYTGKEQTQTLNNLRWLASHQMQERCTLRLPLIKDFNTTGDIQASRQALEAMGFADFDEFEYITEQ